MNIDDLTVGQIKALQGMVTGGDMPAANSVHPYEIGENYLIRTVTHIQIGKLIHVTDKELILVDAAWIADTGRFEQCVKDGQLSEVEPFPDGVQVIVGRGALVDAVKWLHRLPRTQQ